MGFDPTSTRLDEPPSMPTDSTGVGLRLGVAPKRRGSQPHRLLKLPQRGALPRYRAELSASSARTSDRGASLLFVRSLHRHTSSTHRLRSMSTPFPSSAVALVTHIHGGPVWS